MQPAQHLEEQGKQAALDVVESARETEWAHPSFVAELFMGRLRADLLFPYPEQPADDRAIGDVFIKKLETFLTTSLDPEAIDRTGEIPQSVMDGLIRLGCFGMKIPVEYGGLGFSQTNYDRVMALISSHCMNTAVLLSAHQSIGLPTPLKMFGTAEQKQKYLPKLAAGAVSAFALTEPEVGSDPAKMETTADPTPDGTAFILNGEKLWCTNGPIAEFIVVVARTPSLMDGTREKKQLTAFIVERAWPGVAVTHHCRFMGLNGIQNGVLRFTNVRVPKDNILWKEGRGLKLALMTLNTGRLTLPASCIGMAKQCLKISRRWANQRVQWGVPVGKHEAIAVRLARMAAGAFAMESITWLACALVDRGGTDIRLEAAMAKMFCSETSWEIINDAMQIKGGRGYETAESLKARGEPADPIERFMRDSRINLIFEGSSEIMRLFIAREALDPHLRVGGAIFNPRASLGAKFAAAIRMLGFYSHWYPRQWIYFAGHRPDLPKSLQRHYQFVHHEAHHLARALVHAMGRFGPGLERRQMVLWRAVDIGTQLFAMAATCARAAALVQRTPADRTPIDLADLFCSEARQKVADTFRDFTSPRDRHATKLAKQFLAGDLRWLETDTSSHITSCD